MVVVAAAVELPGALLLFRASSRGLGAAGVVLTLLPGLGSRLMTATAELEVLGRGAARRLDRVVVEEAAVKLLVEADTVEVVTGEETGFSGSGAKTRIVLI